MRPTSCPGVGRSTSRRRNEVAFIVAAAIGLVGIAPSASRTQEVAATPIDSVRVTILSTMLADTRGIGEWGFAALVEADGHRLLFDTGARPETVLANAKELGIDLANVTDVVLSHHHGDHIGGLLTLRRELRKTNPDSLSRTFVGRGILFPRPDADGAETNEAIALEAAYRAEGGRFVEIDRPTELFPGAWLTGPVERVHPERNWSGRGQVRTDHGLVEDTIPEDTSLVLETPKGLVVVCGCGHAGVVNTLEFARKNIREAPVHALLGGFHLFAADEAALDWTAGKLKSMEVAHLLGAHCTGIETVYGLRDRLNLDRNRCVVGAVGAGFDLDRGIRPGTIAK